MKRRTLIILLLPLLLTSCSPRKEQGVKSFDGSAYIYENNGDIRVKGEPFVTPFNTSISLNLYYTDGDYSENDFEYLKNTIEHDFKYYHALSDRHYEYNEFKDNTLTPINNIKTINDSYGKNIPIKVDSFLYDLLKESYEFTINSNGYFNMFIGSLNDIYEDKLNNVYDETKSLKDLAFMKCSDLMFSTFSDKETLKISKVTESLPKNSNDFEGILTFNDETSEVTFNKYSFDNGTPLKISLGGNAKGFATEKVAATLKEKYPSISMMINSGFSSLKAVGSRIDEKPWRIKYNNPLFFEVVGLKKHDDLKTTEVAISHDGEFNISTSGYYNQYFLEVKIDQIYRRNHILNAKTGYSESFLDQVSVYLNNAGLADMYTTAIMNCKDINEVNTLFTSLNEKYNEENAGLILCYKSKIGDKNIPYSYSLNDFKDLSSYKLPKLKLKDNTIYDGDYSDLDPDSIMNVVSTFEPNFDEAYLITPNLIDKASYLDEVSHKAKIYTL